MEQNWVLNEKRPEYWEEVTGQAGEAGKERVTVNTRQTGWTLCRLET